MHFLYKVSISSTPNSLKLSLVESINRDFTKASLQIVFVIVVQVLTHL